jgi:hypothetical protein
MTHRTDRGQCLATKAEALHANEVGGEADLRCGVSLEREHGVVALHAAAVVAHADQLASAFLDGDIDGGGAGVECVFDELFHRRCGALHHFAGSNLVGDGGWEYGDACHELQDNRRIGR